MEKYRPLRMGLFVYECIRLMFLVSSFAILRPDEGAAAFPWLTYAAPGALFPLMTLFLWLDISRYGAYGPLYTAGKCISCCSVIGWCLLFRQNILSALLLDNTALLLAPGMAGLLLAGDLLSVAAGVIVITKYRRGGM